MDASRNMEVRRARKPVSRRAFFARVGALGCALGTALGAAACDGGATGEGQASPADDGGGERPLVSDTMESGSGLEPAEQTSSPFAQALLAGEVRSLRLIGDSITAGWGCDGYGATGEFIVYDGPYGTFWETAPSVACWANDLRGYATSLGVGDFVNAGVSGAKMRWLAEYAPAWTREGADAMVVMLGTNDAVYESVESFEELAEEGLAGAAEACEHLLVLAPPRNDRTDAYNSFDTDALERVLADVTARHGWEFVSLLDALELGSSQFCPDQLHPSSEGSHALWAFLQARLGL